TLIQTEMEVCQGAALSFDGVDDVVTTPLPALFNNLATEDFTVETWVNISSSGFTQRLFFAQQDTANFTTALINISNTMYFYVNIDNIYYSTLAVPLPINQWTHVALRWTASTKTVEIFYDGILQNH